ncbi:hypothetical protein K2173_005022 [Erythroxylum novogranatense]|uniref:Uncharacterized protein n=1 Tax=Erythroxylum novogranatense TaxID=1862640 RepID=A0AAV8UB59_9ROSI|nr:hypothetical protein K2173_005022 [Erythroxylum novogranatense]
MYWWWCKLLFSVVSIFSAVVSRANANTVVTGAVFCDQCKDGQISLYDYPICGVLIGMACVDNKGQITTSREETTSWFGKYAIIFDGTTDLSNCYV